MAKRSKATKKSKGKRKGKGKVTDATQRYDERKFGEMLYALTMDELLAMTTDAYDTGSAYSTFASTSG